MNQPFYHALKVKSEICTGCTHCMHVCPTAAIRIKYGKAFIQEAACTDCGMCLKSCPHQAIVVEQDDFNQIFKFSTRVILLPSVLIGQFSEEISEEQIFSELHNMGFTYVMEVDKSVPLLIEENKKYMQKFPHKKPFISSFCPAVIRLIQVRFPALIDHIIRLKQGMDIAAIYARKKFLDKGVPEEEIGVFYVTQCAAKIAAIKSPVGEDKSSVDGVINMNFIYNKILLAINKDKNRPITKVPEQYYLKPECIRWTLTEGEACNYEGRCLAIDEIHNVIDILEKIENDELVDIDFLELRACDHSCAGGALTANNRFLTIERLNKRMEEYVRKSYSAINKMPLYKDDLIPLLQLTGEIQPRSIEKLDEDFSQAIKKMEQISKMMKILPQVDCGLCGTPSCKALAKDVVMGKAKLNQCIFKQKILLKEELITSEEALSIIAKIWGEDKFE